MVAEKHRRMVDETKHLLTQIVNGLKLPEPEIEFKTRIESCDEADLVKQKEATVYQMRVAQFKALGFYPFGLSDVIDLLKGQPYNKTTEADKRHNYDYHYRHNEHTVKTGSDCTWGVKNPSIYHREEREGLWFMPPFSKKTQWTIKQVFKLDDFIAPIPGDLLEAINYLRKKGFFNTYQGYQCTDTGDAVITGSVAELEAGGNSTGDSTSFYVGSFISESK